MRSLGRVVAMVVAALMIGQLFVLTGSDPAAAATSVLYRVNSGGAQLAGEPVWSTDTKPSPSPYVNASETNSTYSTSQAIDVSDASIPAGTPAGLFNTERWDKAGGAEMQYSFPVLAGQAVEVRLFFAENYSGAQVVGGRVFDVAVDGVVRVDDLDVFATAGAYAGHVETIPVTSDGTVDISFIHQVENPSVKGIEIVTTDGAEASTGTLAASPASLGFGDVEVGATATQSVTISNSAASGADPIVVSSASITGTNPSAFTHSLVTPVTLAPGDEVVVAVTFAPEVKGSVTATLTFVHDGSNGPQSVSLSGSGFVPTSGGQVLYRVNSGGSDLLGDPTWLADTKAAPSQYVNAAETNVTASSGGTIDTSDPSVPSGTPAGLFNSERWDKAGGAELQYSFPVVAGQAVEVRLYFAETYSLAQAVGARVFDVAIDEVVVIDDLDVYAEVGASKGLAERRLVTSDGSVDITFLHQVENPAVKGIEIVAAAAQADQLGAQPTSLSLPSTPPGSSSSATVQLRNLGGTGDPSITVTSTSITGTDATVFSDGFNDASEVILAPGETLNVQVTFSPTTSGARSATLAVSHSGVNSPLSVPLSGDTVTVGFQPKAALAGATPGFPTSIDWGPDGRLYVGTIYGTIHAYEISRDAVGSYSVVSSEAISHISTMPNHDDDGQLNANVDGRLVTGIDVVGTAAAPVLYAVSSDPRIGGGKDGTDLPLDTNSGILSRLTKSSSGWTKVDLVRGLPRSEENHTGNGLVVDEGAGIVYIAYGGHTNKGAPSFNFANLSEYALSAAILSVDIGAIGSTTYDLPTLDDEDRPGTLDANDPFGGNTGKNQARLVPGGPVQIHSSGWRNPYDLVVTEAGHMYAIDNGGNAGWGGFPLPDNADGTCTNDVIDTSDSDPDTLIRIPSAGYYAGHPNPVRANPDVTFNSTNPQSPVSAHNPIECDYLDPATERNAIKSFGSSTNGLAEYTTDNFGGSLKGSLLAASYDNSIQVVHLDSTGTAATSSGALFSNVGSLPLDVIASKATDPFPGVIVVADAQANSILFFEPYDFDGNSTSCTGADDEALDEDGDGYSNHDEILNGTNPCSAADVPPDNDGDSVSDLLDPDDDNDGIPDVDDAFAIDPMNGRGTQLPVQYGWENDGSNPGGFLNLGFTGHMTNGAETYVQQFDPEGMTAGGAAGVTTVDSVSAGTAHASANDQRFGLQFGVDVDASTAPFSARTALVSPFTSTTVSPGQELGIFVGTGTQDDYVELVASTTDGGKLIVRKEVGGVLTTVGEAALPLPGPGDLALALRIDPAAATAEPIATVDGGAPIAVTAPFSIPAGWFTAASGPAVGMISTSAGSSPFTATWDYMDVVPDVATIESGSVAVDEGDTGPTTVDVPVTLSKASTETVTVQWATDDTLTQPEAGVDYESASGTLTFAPGQTQATVPFTVIGDTVDEPGQLWGAEWAAIRFSDPTNAAIGTDAETSYVLIVDDDDPVVPTVSIDSVAVDEGDSTTTTAQVPVRLSEPTTTTVTVQWATDDSLVQPEPGVDYVPGSGTVTFTPGQTMQTVPFTVIGDTVDEPGQLWGAEWGVIKLSSPVNAVFGAGDNADTGFTLIVDDDDATLPSGGASTMVEVNTNNTLVKSSTYTSGSFQVTNASTDASEITSVSFDLSTATLPDLVFDPNGGAGDTVGKDLQIDSGGATTGAQAHAFSGPHDDGYDVVTIPFADFGPGEEVTFSVDVDPTSIRGSAQPGPNDSGSVSGLELGGATVTVTYADGTTQVSRLFRTPGSLVNSRAVLTGGAAPVPTISIAGVATPASVSSSTVTLDVRGGVPGSTVRIVAAEGGLYTDGLLDGGYDIDPFEANTVVQVAEESVVLDGSGNGSLSFTLSRSSSSDGIWHFIAATELADGDTHASSDVVVVEYTG